MNHYQSCSFNQGFLDWSEDNPFAWEKFKELTAPFELERVVQLAFTGIDNAARSEALFKSARKAKVLDLVGSASAYEEAAGAFHQRSIGQLSAAVEAAHDSVCLSEATEQTLVGDLDEFLQSGYADFMRHEVLPDLRLRILESDLAPVEAGILYQSLQDIPTEDTTVKAQLEGIRDSIRELIQLRQQNNRGVETTQDNGGTVTKWKKAGVKVITKIIRVLILICKLLLVCFVVEWIIETLVKVVVILMKLCADPKPAP